MTEEHSEYVRKFLEEDLGKNFDGNPTLRELGFKEDPSELLGVFSKLGVPYSMLCSDRKINRVGVKALRMTGLLEKFDGEDRDDRDYSQEPILVDEFIDKLRVSDLATIRSYAVRYSKYIKTA